VEATVGRVLERIIDIGAASGGGVEVAACSPAAKRWRISTSGLELVE